MPVLAMIVLDDTQVAAANALNTDSVSINPRQIDNTLANALGYGTMVGLWVITARTLIDPDYTAWADWYAAESPQPPIRVLDTDTLFLPPPPDQ